MAAQAREQADGWQAHPGLKAKSNSKYPGTQPHVAIQSCESPGRHAVGEGTLDAQVESVAGAVGFLFGGCPWRSAELTQFVLRQCWRSWGQEVVLR